MADTYRLFIALELPPPVQAALDDVQTHLRREVPSRTVRWVRSDAIHLTLKFLGDTPTAQLNALKTALAGAVKGHSALALAVQELGCFPNPSRPRVLWAGLRGDLEALAGLQQAVEAAMNGLGFAPEDRAFTPHLTLGRIRQDASRNDAKVAGGLVASTGIGEIAAWTADTVSLMRSELRPEGARYTRLGDFSLAG